MSSEHASVQSALAALEAQRAVLGDAVVDAAASALRARLALLDQGQEAPQALRQVSILFLDIVGSTSLTQRLDPEQVHEVMDGALQRCTQIVQNHHGRVLQYAGDNLLATFGADLAFEDDAERAVRCGLALLDTGRALGREVLDRHGHAGFDVRVGVHSGRVLLGGGVDAEGTIRGIAVNIAARMEQTAPAGTLRISNATQLLVRGLFELESQAPATVKGVDEPIVSYLVQRALPRPFRLPTRGVEGVATRMVGRQAELQALQQALRGVAGGAGLQTVIVVGDAGLGKSRLLLEFEASLPAGQRLAEVLRARAQPHTRGRVYGLLHDLFARWAQINDDDDRDLAAGRLEQAMLPLFAADTSTDEATGHAHLLAHLIGIDPGDSPHLAGIRDDPRQLRDRAFHAAVELLTRLQRHTGHPLLMLLEDLHWADDASLAFLGRLATEQPALPLLIVALSRPALFERGGDVPAFAERAQRVGLAPLSGEAGAQLMDELLRHVPVVPEPLRELLLGRAVGNPFFMEELVNMLVERGAIDAGVKPWRVHVDRLRAADVPLTLTGVLQSRLDSLPRQERLALQEASVIGPAFWDRALQAIDEAAVAQLPALERRALTLQSPAKALTGVAAAWCEYRFSHHLLHQVTYDTVLGRQRRTLHRSVARWLAGQGDSHARDSAASIAEHFERAGDGDDAAEYWARAAEKAQARLVADLALAQAQRGLALLDATPKRPLPALRWRLLTLCWSAQELLGRRSEQQASEAALQALAEHADDDRWRGEVAYLRSISAQLVADWQGADAAALEAMALAERAGDLRLRLLGQCQRAIARRYLFDFKAARALAEAGLAEARRLGMRPLQQKFLSALSNVVAEQHDLLRGQSLREEMLAIARELGNLRSQAIALGNLGNGARELGDLPLARQQLSEAVGLMRRAGDRSMLCAPLAALAATEVQLGNARAARGFAIEARDVAQALGSRMRLGVAWLCLGDAELALGQLDAAEAAYVESNAWAHDIGDTTWLDGTVGLARVALARDDGTTALRHVETLLAHLLNGGGEEVIDARRTEITCHAVLARAGDPRAADWLARAHERLQAQAAAIADPQRRQTFLHGLTEHREILDAWQAAAQPLPGGGP
jgi:predicted ATPase/class 3 adenylate cyclase